ncbi:MAG TPA: nitrilase-related carbon-nitrogen hydrolase [Kribbella sp.]
MRVKVAACQVPAQVGTADPAPVERAIRAAAAEGAALIVVPELAVSGYCFRSAAEARAAAESPDGPTVRLIRSLTAELGCVVVAGYCELGADGRVYNSAVLAEDGELRAHYRKVHLWGREPEWFAAGDAPPPVVETRAGRIAVLICYDLEMPEWTRLAALAGADIIAAPCNWPLLDRPSGERPVEVVKAQAAAASNAVHVVVADRCGRERGVDWIGGSVVVDASGYLAADVAFDVPAAPRIVIAELDLEASRDKSLGEHNHVLGDRRPELYGAVTVTCP